MGVVARLAPKLPAYGVRHAPDDERLGEPLCPDCYDYAGSVLFNALSPELWRRFTLALRRNIAKAAGLQPALVERRPGRAADPDHRNDRGHRWQTGGGHDQGWPVPRGEHRRRDSRLPAPPPGAAAGRPRQGRGRVEGGR
ncbi:replication initiator [Streptosporangium sandarakinum]|uniref:replication initiator n=1 Tax=Streptosporangium sandarakinum TaxID=1260955 RepID=UPI003D8F7E71